MLNFCNPEDSQKHKSAIKILTNDLMDSIIIGAIGVVVHMGKKLDMDENVAIDNYVKGIKTVLNQTPKESIIILETGAGQGTEICTSIFNLGKLYRRFTKGEQQRIKFCIDTCHIFAAGYNIGHINYVNLFCNLIKTHLSWDNIACIHLNDSECILDSRKDRHANIGNGCIKLKGLKKFTQICGNKGIPIVLETPCSGDDKNNEIKLIKSWFD
jgi:deoxyribonuclease-4